MKILTAGEMRAVDRAAIGDLGIPGLVLMENAGRHVAEAILGRYPDPGSETIVIAAGKGNNGGDGFVAARHLFNAGARPTVLLLASKAEVSGDAAVNLAIALKVGIPVTEIRSEQDWPKAAAKLRTATVIVDALFGTGLQRPLGGLFAKAVEGINRSPGYTVSVDIPSGLSSDAFEVIGPAVRADLTVTLAAPKVAHIFPPADEYVGDLIVAEIGIPSQLFDNPALKLELLEPEAVLPFFRKRKKDAHKGTYGHVLVVAGSLGKGGAAALAGRAALRMGAGLVTVATAASALPSVARSMSELMTEPVAETEAGTISSDAVTRVSALLAGRNALLLGPGIGTGRSTADFVRALLPRIKVPAVIDADALNILAADLGALRGLKAPAVLTPHPGEFARLTGLTTAEVLKHRLDLVPSFAAKHGVTVVFKGHRTLVAAPDGRVFVNPTGNPGMATGGSGDVLGGLIASQLVQERDPLGAVLSAVYIHGLAGDLAADRLSQKALTAGDLLRYLPAALRSMETERP